MAFQGKAALLRLKRLIENSLSPNIKRLAVASDLVDAQEIAISVTPLWSETDKSEKLLVAGKIHNLRLAVKCFHGVELGAGDTFSFWKQLGRASRLHGYVPGRELREGCIVPSVGGGLCQISNAIYDAALQAGLEVVERHAHTQVIAGSLAEKGRDATVFWNYVDLRFKARGRLRLEASLDGKYLTVRFRADAGTKPVAGVDQSVPANTVNSCASCGELSCRKMIKDPGSQSSTSTAYLLDEYSPEFDGHISGSSGPNTELFIPMDGKRFHKPNYAWNVKAHARVRQSLAVTFERSIRSRRLHSQGAARQKNLLKMSEQLASSYARKIRFDTLHLVIQQPLLPFLWRDGHLGGRTFDVLMASLPMSQIQRRLDAASELHPYSETLGDFRADTELLAFEDEALAAAEKIVTPHKLIADMYPGKTETLKWKMPPASSRRPPNNKPVVAYPASTVGRKGCYELRQALQGSDIKLLTLGPIIEESDFWREFDASPAETDWVERADVVVLPAFIEHRPRRLLEAAASGIPVIASEACGLHSIENVDLVSAGDVNALITALNRHGIIQ